MVYTVLLLINKDIIITLINEDKVIRVLVDIMRNFIILVNFIHILVVHFERDMLLIYLIVVYIWRIF